MLTEAEARLLMKMTLEDAIAHIQRHHPHQAVTIRVGDEAIAVIATGVSRKGVDALLSFGGYTIKT